jgi:hypothetical protein
MRFCGARIETVKRTEVFSLETAVASPAEMPPGLYAAFGRA